MIAPELTGTCSTVDVTPHRKPPFRATVGEFSTYSAATDSYSWKEFEEVTYAMVPAGTRGDDLSVAVSVVTEHEDDIITFKQTLARLFEQDFFSRVCTVSFAKLGTPKMFMKLKQMAEQQS